jgi:hypothetical protein
MQPNKTAFRLWFAWEFLSGSNSATLPPVVWVKQLLLADVVGGPQLRTQGLRRVCLEHEYRRVSRDSGHNQIAVRVSDLDFDGFHYNLNSLTSGAK